MSGSFRSARRKMACTFATLSFWAIVSGLSFAADPPVDPLMDVTPSVEKPKDFSQAPSYPVLLVSDSDTLVVKQDGETKTIRLLGIEGKDKSGAQFLKEHLKDKSVYLEYADSGRKDENNHPYAHAYVAPGGEAITQTMVKNGEKGIVVADAAGADAGSKTVKHHRFAQAANNVQATNNNAMTGYYPPMYPYGSNRRRNNFGYGGYGGGYGGYGGYGGGYGFPMIGGYGGYGYYGGTNNNNNGNNNNNNNQNNQNQNGKGNPANNRTNGVGANSGNLNGTAIAANGFIPGSKNPSMGGGGFRNPSMGAGGFYNPSMGGGGFKNPSMGAGGFYNPSLGGGGFSNPSMGAGGFYNPSMGGGGFYNPSMGGGGFYNPSMGGGGFHMPSMGGGGFHMPSMGGGGFHMPSMGGGGFHGGGGGGGRR